MERFYSFSPSSCEEELFFDSRDDLSVSSESDENLTHLYQVFLNDSETIQQRRERFMNLMGLDLIKPESIPEPPNELISLNNSKNELDDSKNDELDSEKPLSDEETIISISGSLSTKSSLSRWSSDKRSTVSEDSTVSDAGFDWSLYELTRDGNFSNSGKKDDNSSVKKDKTYWLRKLGIKTNLLETHPKFGSNREERVFERVKMKIHKKNFKEFSEVYRCQDFKAHDHAILTMKFSPDNMYLATGGEMGLLRVWSVADQERSELIDFDSNCVYFEINENDEIAPVSFSEKKESKHNRWQSGHLTCVVVPKKVFCVQEEPVQDFKGHFGDILDISWSQSKYLISASVDKTVRLWQIGCENCLKIFSHQNYVTCVQFNPSNEDYFVSGSIDGIIRIWQIPLGHVVNWTETKDIVTAVCYQPDGKKVVVGTITGQCRFYDVSDNQLELKYEVSHQGKKKSSHKRITGFEFSPCDSTKLMISSADSQIRILEGSEVLSTYKGLKSHASHASPCFSQEGNHLISSSDDSIYLLTNNNNNNNNSFEQFTSQNTSLAIPFNNKPADLSSFVPMQAKGTAATWPEEKLTPGSGLTKSQCRLLRTACEHGTDLWGQVVVTAGWDGSIKCYQNFGLPVQV